MFSEYKGFWAMMGLVTTVYCIVAWRLPTDVFWSPDEGGKFLQTHGWWAEGTNAYQIPYPGRDHDPDYRFYPKRAMYPQPSAEGAVAFGWHPWFSFLSLLPYKLFGIRGLYVLPFLGAILAAAIVGFAAHRVQPGSWPFVVFGVALASPMLFYGVLFWEHTLAVCAGMAAVSLSFLGVQKETIGFRWTIGVPVLLLLALAIGLRFEMTILPLSLLMALVVNRWGVLRRIRLRPVVVTALVLMAGSIGLGVWVGRHLRFPAYVANMTATALSRLSDAGTWQTLPGFVAGAVVNSSEEAGMPLSRAWMWMGCIGSGLCVASCVPVGRVRFGLWLFGAVLVASVAWVAVTLPERYRAVHSLLLPAPFLLLALLPLPKTSPPDPVRSNVEVLAATYLVLYLALAFSINGVQGGAEWGARYGLALYPVLGFLAGIKCQAFLASGEPMPIRKTVAVVIACGLLALGMLFSVRGIGEIRRTKADLRSFADEIRVSGDVVVTDQWWLPAALAPTFVEREIYTIPAGGSLAAWVGHVGRLSKRFLFVSYDGAPADEEAIQALGVRLSGSKLLNGMHFLRYEAVRP